MVTAVKLGEVMAQVAVDIGGGNQFVAAITHDSAERLGLGARGSVVALVKGHRGCGSIDAARQPPAGVDRGLGAGVRLALADEPAASRPTLGKPGGMRATPAWGRRP